MTSRLDGLVRAWEKTPSLSRADIEAIQLKKINALLRRLKASGRAFYARLPENIDSLEALKYLPFTTPDDLRARGDELLLAPQSGIERVVSERTSGSTGAPKRVYYTSADCDRTVDFFAAGLGEIAGEGDSVLVCMPFSGGRGLGEMIAEALTRLGAEPVRAAGLRFGELHELVESRRTSACVAPPTLLLSLLRLYGAGSLKRSVVSGDACLPSVAAGIERVIGKNLFPHYGLREFCMAGAATCPAHAGMHLRENDILAEIIGKNGRPLPDGERGELVLTGIGMNAAPLLRYRTGDTAVLTREVCPCGCSLARLLDVRRMGSPMQSLDERLFALDFLIDYKIENHLMTALALDGAGAEEIKKAAPELFSSAGYELEVARAGDYGAPLYSGKRWLIMN